LIREINSLAYTKKEGLEIQDRIFLTAREKFQDLEKLYNLNFPNNRKEDYSSRRNDKDLLVGNAGFSITHTSTSIIGSWTQVTPTELLEENLIALEPFCTEFKSLSSHNNPINDERFQTLNDYITLATASMIAYARTNNIESEIGRIEQQINEWCGTDQVMIGDRPSTSLLAEDITESIKTDCRPEEPSKQLYRKLREIKPLCEEMLFHERTSDTILSQHVSVLFAKIVTKTRQLLQYSKENQLSHEKNILDTVSEWCGVWGCELLHALNTEKSF
jgi:hypothetical protein